MQDVPRHRRKCWPVLVILLMALVAMMPALLFDQLTRGDARFHLRWQHDYAPIFWTGDPVPHWLPDMNMGFGSPAFFLYPPLTQWAASLLAPLFPAAGFVPFRLAASATIALFLGGIGMWRWLTAAIEDERAALFGGLLYMVLPYHLYIDTYHRAALAELWALAVAPFAFYGVQMLARGGAPAVAVLVSGLAFLFLAHAPSALMIVPLVIAYAAVLSRSRHRWHEILATIGATVLAVMLSGFYLATALTHSRYINAVALFDGRMSPVRWLIGGGTWPDTSLTPVILLVNILHLGVVALAIGLVVRHDRGRDGAERRTLMLLLLTVVGATALLQTALARGLWMLPTPLARIQFPWRLLTVQTLAVAAAGALLMRLARGRRGWRTILLAALPVMLMLDGALLAYRIHREAEYHREPAAAAAILTETRDAPEYQLGDVAALASRFGRARAIVPGGGGTATVTRWRPRTIAMTVVADRPVEVVVRQFAYSGWRYRIDGAPWRMAGRSGALLSVSVPAGHHDIRMELAVTAMERVGNLLPLAGSILLIAWLIVAARKGGADGRMERA